MPARFLVLFGSVVAVELLAQAGEARFPSREAADHRRVHQQPLPKCGSGGLVLLLGHLSQREILGEARGREPFHRAIEQREQSAPRHVGTAGCQRAVRGDPGAPQSLQNQRLVTLRGAQQNGDLVERDAPGRRGVDGAGDLYAFQRFAGGREDDHAAIVLACRDRVARKEISLQGAEAGGGFRAAGFQVQFQRGVRGGHHRGEKLALQPRARRQIERDDRRFAQLVVGRGERIARQVDARRMVGEPAFGQLAGVSLEQAREVRPGFAAVAQVLGVDGVEPQFFKGSGQGAGKAWKSGHRPQVGELAASQRLGRDARRQRLPHEPAHRHEPPAVQLRGGQLQDQFAECEPAHAHQGLAASRQGDLFGRRADRRQNQHGARGGPLRDKLHGPAAQFGIRGHWSCWRWYRESLRWGMIERPALFP